MTDDPETEVTQDVTRFVAELRRLADALESGSAYTIDLDGDLVTIPMNAMLSVAHEEDDGDVELEFQLSWSLDDVEEEDIDDEADEADTEKQSEPA
jgi:amphi-Trp domain-containing protein